MDLFSLNAFADLLLEYVLVGPLFPFLHLAHAMHVINGYKPLLKDKPWLLSLSICMVQLFFGSTIRSLCLGIHPIWLDNNVVLPTMVILWFIVWYCPGDLILEFYNQPYCKPSARVAEWCYKARSIVHGIHETCRVLSYPSVFAVLLFGTLGGAAGSFWKSLVVKTVLNDSSHRSELSKLQPVFKLSFYASVFYYFATDPKDILFGAFLTHRQALFYVIVYFTVYAISTIFRDNYVPFPFNLIERLVGFLCSPFSVDIGHYGRPKEELKQLPVDKKNE